MTWTGGVGGEVPREAYAQVQDLADWSAWAPLETAVDAAPREPGVYLLREPGPGVVRHVGMTGDRAGGGRPQGLRGRLTAYRSGTGPVGGFGEAALDRALADPDWVEAQLSRLRRHGPRRLTHWARDAVGRLGLEVTWSVCADRSDAAYLERQVVAVLRPHGLWTR